MAEAIIQLTKKLYTVIEHGCMEEHDVESKCGRNKLEFSMRKAKKF